MKKLGFSVKGYGKDQRPGDKDYKQSRDSD